MSLKSFLISKTFLIQLAVAIALTIGLLWITMLGIRMYTNHGESMPVPDLNGLQVDQAEELLKSQHLEYEISDSTYLDTAEPGAVIGQMPEAGHKVKEGRTIFLTICALSPEQVAMPKLTDISFRQAVNIMQTLGLNVGRIEYVPSEFSNLVLAQRINGEVIAPNEMVNKGSRVDLTIGKTSNGEKTVVPNLVGSTLVQAKGEIASLFLNVGAVIYDETIGTQEDSLAAKVWKQRPTHTSYDEVEQGASIDLWLTIDETKIVTDTDLELEKDSIGE
jgi:beta-lactam-binding protein with PASTA domain